MNLEEKISRLRIPVNKSDLDEFAWHKIQLTKDEAISFSDSELDKSLSDKEIVNIQLFQIRKCTNRFFDSISKVSKFPPSLEIISNHDLCANAHLNLPNDEKFNFTSDACAEYILSLGID